MYIKHLKSAFNKIKRGWKSLGIFQTLIKIQVMGIRESGYDENAPRDLKFCLSKYKN